MDALVRLLTIMPLCAACAGPGLAQDHARVSFATSDNSRTAITGLLFRPEGDGPFGAVVGMHGCNGLFESDGIAVAHYASWGRVLREAGYLVLLVDSLGSRGIASLCGSRGPSPIRWEQLSSDAYGALAYLKQRADVRASAIAVMGWSMGGDAVLRTISDESAARPAGLLSNFSAAIAFYPGGCARLAREGNWSPDVPLLLQLGKADNYTPPQPCVEMIEKIAARRTTVELDLYGDAYHLFDHPDMPAHPFTRIVYRDGSSPMIGSNAAARAAAISRVKEFLRRRFETAK